MDEPTISRRLLLGFIGLTVGLTLGFLSLVNYRAQCAFEEAQALVTDLTHSSALLTSGKVDRLIATAEQGFIPVADLFFLRASLLLGPGVEEARREGTTDTSLVAFAATVDSGPRLSGAPLEGFATIESATIESETIESEAIESEADWDDLSNKTIEKAAELFRRGLLHDPFKGRIHLALANLYAHLGHRVEADAAADLALRSAPYHRDLLLRLAENSFYRWIEEQRPEDLDHGIELLARVNTIAPELIPETLPLVELADSRRETLNRIVPDTLSGRLSFANYLAKNGRLEEGIEELESAFRMEESTDENRANGYITFSQRLEKIGRIDDALAMIEKARAVETGGFFRGERQRARLLLHLGRIEEAQESLIAALRKGRDREEILQECFANLRTSGHVGDSLPLWERLLEEFPFFEPTNYFLAMTLMANGDEEPAIKLLQKYVRTNADVNALTVLSNSMIGRRQWRVALQYVERALIYSPADKNLASLRQHLHKKINNPGPGSRG